MYVHVMFITCIYSKRGSDGMYLLEEETNYKIPTQAVIRLIKLIFGSNQNITTGNWYTSMELGNVLKANKLTLVGTYWI